MVWIVFLTHLSLKMLTNNEELLLPTWLKPQVFEPLLRQTIDNFFAIKNFEARSGTRPGDNYATIMLRIELEVELTDKSTKSFSYMLKTPHNSDTYNEVLGKTNIYDIEYRMFTQYVEEFRQLYRQAGLEVEFGTKSYRLNVPENHVLLEDLRPKGFKPTNRQAGLDEEHTLSVLKKIAQWHAASAVRVATKGAYPTEHTEGLFTEESKALRDGITDGMLKYVLRSLKTIEGHEAYYDDVQNMSGHVYDMMMRIAYADPLEFNVLNHGDCWLSNIMFQHDESTGKLLETYLVDFQVPKYASVALDLLYFLISSPKLELKISKFDYFVKYYYDQLIIHLNLLKYSKCLPTLIDIHTALLKYGSYGYATACGVMTGVLLEPTEDANFDNLFADTEEGEAFRTLLFSGEAYKDHLKIIMPWLHNRGALQYQQK